MMQFAERLVFKLADPLPRYIAFLADILQGVDDAVIQSEPHPQDLLKI